MNVLGNGLDDARYYEDALPVREAELAMKRRLGAGEDSILVVQSNLASTYQFLGRREEALSLRRVVYSGRVNLVGEDHRSTLGAAVNYASTLFALEHYAEARALLRQTIPAAQRVLGENHEITLKMRKVYAQSLCCDRRHARRSPRGRDDARGHGTDCAARARGFAPFRCGY